MEKREIVKTKNKGECVQVVGDDLEGISNMVLSAFCSSGGTPARYPNTAEGLQAFRDRTREFFEHIVQVNKENRLEKGVIPDIELWTGYLGITRTTVFNYEHKRGGEWSETIRYIKNLIAAYKKQMGLTYKIPPMIMAFDFCNNHNYVNTSEFKITTEVVNGESEQRRIIDEELKENGLRWNEDTQSFEPI